MISFLSSPKLFSGPHAEIQGRAVRSWLQVHPTAEVLLYGPCDLPAELASEPRIRAIAEIESSASGVPRFDAIAAEAARSARYDLQVYLNCDILLPPEFGREMMRIDLPKFLLIGQRIDLAEGVEFDPVSGGWVERISALAKARRLELHEPTAVDYFCFKRGTWQGLPPLIVGRGGYDGALVAYCLRHGIPVVDATWAVAAVHQYHDYAHVAGGVMGAHRGLEAMQNYRLHDVQHSTPGISDADYQLRGATLVALTCRGDWLRAAEITVRHRWGLKYVSYPLRALWRLATACGYKPIRPVTLDELLHAYTILSTD